MLRTLKLFFFFSALLLIVLTFLPLLIDKKSIVNSINQKVANELDIQINFSDDVEVTFFPFPTIQANDVSFKDEKNGIDITSQRVKVLSSWNSLINLNPEFSSLEFFSPIIRYKDVDVSGKFSDLKIPVGLESKDKKAFNFIKKKIKKIKLHNGKLRIVNSQNIFKFKNINISYESVGHFFIKGDFDYENYPSHFLLDASGFEFDEIDFQLEQKIKNENKLQTKGKLSFDGNDVFFKGKTESDLLKLDELFLVASQLSFFKRNDDVVFANLSKPNFRLDLDVGIKNMIYDSLIFENARFKIISDKKKISFKNLHFNFNESSVKSEAVYHLAEKKINGKAMLENFLIEEKYFGKTKYDLLEGKMDCSFNFEVSEFFNDITKAINKSLIQGKCNSGKVKLRGIDLKNIASKIDDLDSLPKFLALINQKNTQGFSIIKSIDLNFMIKKGVLRINGLKSIQDNVRINSTGNYDLISDRLNIKNEFLVRTEKYKNLPPFRINFNGSSSNYKVSYDFQEIRDVLFAEGINKILKKKKKIVINPGSLKGILKGLDLKKEVDPEKIIDLFLN